MAFLSDYWKKRRTSLKFLIRTSKRKFSQRRFHVLRVELKKLKALLLLVGYYEKDLDQLKFYKPFKSLFRQAGRVRELQIERGILKAYGNDPLPELRKSLDRTIKKERGIFFQKRKLKLNKLMEKRLKSLNIFVKKLEKADFKPYLNTLLDEIKLILVEGKLEESTGHQLRKKLKTLKYNLESLQNPNFLQVMEGHEDLVNLLGTWHDLLRVNELLLEDLSSSEFSPEELIHIQQVRQRIAEEIEEISEKINRKISLFDIAPPECSLTLA